MANHPCDVAIVGAGIIGISTAYYVTKLRPDLRVALIDSLQPMSMTSAQSGENYRNWWPHPFMTAFTDHSISLMESIATTTDNVINMNRNGYVLATRTNDISQLQDELVRGYQVLENNEIRQHDSPTSATYSPPSSDLWNSAPQGVDVITHSALIRTHFPTYDSTVKSLVHIRRAGDISGQQLGQFMLDQFKQAGGKRITGKVQSIEKANRYVMTMQGSNSTVNADKIVNAAGPFINAIAGLLGTQLPIFNTLQQKIAFEDTQSIVVRDMPFTIDLDAQWINWSDEERELLSADDHFRWLTEEMPGAIHCRPDGGKQGKWVKLGWAFNHAQVSPEMNPQLLPSFPEIVLRGASRLHPQLQTYLNDLPSNRVHYGGYYTMTDENWPLIGPMEPENTFVAGAMSGFGTMAACAAGELCAQWVTESSRPYYADAFSTRRYRDRILMSELSAQRSRGIL